MKYIHTIIGAFAVVCLSFTVLAVEFPGSKDDHRVVSVRADGKVIAELKLLAPATIDASGTNVSVSAQPGGKYMMKIDDGSVEIRPEKGKPIKITGELIYIYGYGKRDEKK